MTSPPLTRDALVERIARELVRSRGAAVVASDQEWPPAVKHFREMCEKYPDYADGRSLVTDAFRDAAVSLAAIHDAGLGVVAYEAFPAVVWPSIAAADLAAEKEG